MSAISVSNSTIDELFSTASYQFRIPDYQRPYSWTEKEVSSLLDDIASAFPYGESSESDEDYFLGSVVLIKKRGNPQADIVDGQQRITTLTLILSVICHLLTNETQKSKIRSQLIETVDFLDENKKTPVLRLRDSDDKFFGQWIREGQNLDEITKVDTFDKSASEQRLILNIKYLLEEQLHKPETVEILDWLTHLLKKITRHCYLVTISTEDFNSAYRIFSTINSRGLNLKPNDVLKSEIIGKVHPELRSQYTQIWDIEESDLGRDDFERLFFTIRSFLLNKKQYTELLTSYRKEILPRFKATDFIDKVLKPSSDTFEQIKKVSFVCNNLDHQRQIRDLCSWLNEIDNNDWLPSAIYFLISYPNDSGLILQFLTQLERLAAGLMISRTWRKERDKIFASLISSIKESPELAISQAHKSLGKGICTKVVKALDDKIYEGKAKPYRNYVLLRLDSKLADGGKSPSFDRKPTIEHILPQNPNANSQWRYDWNESEIKYWVHRLGNLAFLSGKANAKAKNYDFFKKKGEYFISNSEVPVYPITTKVLNENCWTPEVVRRFQENYVLQLIRLWDLDAYSISTQAKFSFSPQLVQQ